MAEVRYGTHQRQVLDFWQAESETPTPLVFVIHGGGWQGGSKERAQRFADVAALLKAGISVVAINYRLIKQAGGSRHQAAGQARRCMMRLMPCSSSAATRRSGTWTSSGLERPVVPPGRVRVCGLPFTTISPIRIAATLWLASRPG